MEIIKLLPEGKTEKVLAKAYTPIQKDREKEKENKVYENKTYFNILHGSRDFGYYCYKLFLDYKIFKDIELSKKDGYVLDGNDFVLKPIYKNDKPLKNRDNRSLYNITKEDTGHLHKSTLVLWDIPNFMYNDVNFKIISGYAVVIGVGKSGVERDGVKYKSPAPVLEVMGDVIIEWSGVSSVTNEKVGERLTRKNNIWTSVQIKEELKDEKDNN